VNLIKKLFSTRQPVSGAPAQEDLADPRKVGFQDAFNSGWYQRETGELLQGFKIVPEDTVLDVGCGDGLATLFCASQGAHVVFSDVDERKIENLKEKALRSKARKVEAHVSDSTPLPLADAYASKVLAMEMLEHTEDPEAIVCELVRVGKPGAQYLITVPDERSEALQQPFASARYFEQPNHIQVFDKKHFCDLVESSGLVIEKYTTWGFFWVMWMSIFWIVPDQPAEGETMGMITPPYHDALQRWADTWNEIMKLPNAQSMADAFNRTLPKAQAVIARKPG
jgi:2-polyprenyl-3-methyl-5-hydroxy-6-metoxy-1,4-benzoquinol methylase